LQNLLLATVRLCSIIAWYRLLAILCKDDLGGLAKMGGCVA